MKKIISILLLTLSSFLLTSQTVTTTTIVSKSNLNGFVLVPTASLVSLTKYMDGVSMQNINPMPFTTQVCNLDSSVNFTNFDSVRIFYTIGCIANHPSNKVNNNVPTTTGYTLSTRMADLTKISFSVSVYNTVDISSLTVVGYKTNLVTGITDNKGLLNQSDIYFSQKFLKVKGTLSENLSYEVFDLSGKLVINKSELLSENELNLNSGLFIVNISDGKSNQILSKKILVQ